jgi:endonuclease YncB( thermonuclease family)
MWTYRAALIQVIDGDTLRLDIDLGFHVRTQQDIRLLAVSAPERNQPGGEEATTWVEDWLDHLVALRWPLLVTTAISRIAEPDEKRTFTRYLGTITDIVDGRNLNTDLADYLTQHPEWGSGT